MTANSNEETSKYDQAISDCHYRSANRLLKLCRDNGGVFIKVGQHIGALDYLLPEEYVSTMQVLHNRAPEMDVKQVYAVIREDLKQEVIFIVCIQQSSMKRNIVSKTMLNNPDFIIFF